MDSLFGKKLWYGYSVYVCLECSEKSKVLDLVDVDVF